jgi:uncharacterized protein (TIGR03492 family)
MVTDVVLWSVAIGAMSMRLLCLSNGHGEDQIAVRILEALRAHANAPMIDVLPIVGNGAAYQKANFSIIGPTQVMPSGGFINLDAGKQLARDLEAGLVRLTLAQRRAIREWTMTSAEPRLVLAVGDIVPLIFAWRSGLPFAFVGTAKSEYYLRDETGWHERASWWDDRFLKLTGGVYLPWERWLLRRDRCRAVFPRDPLTVAQLQAQGVGAIDAGNPMMDGLGAVVPVSLPETGPVTIALIPGSRPPELYENWALMVQAVRDLSNQLDRSVNLLAAVIPQVDPDQIAAPLAGWRQVEPHRYQCGSDAHVTNLTIHPGGFVECIQQSQLAIAMAGTATEQFVGLGKPVVTLPGAGPQFVPAFAEAQTRLLGHSVYLVERPAQVAVIVQQLLTAPPQTWQAIAENGHRRMGFPGAAQRIANCLMQQFEQLPQQEF